MTWDDLSLDDQGSSFDLPWPVSELPPSSSAGSPTPSDAGPPTTGGQDRQSSERAARIWRANWTKQDLVLWWPSGTLLSEQQRILEEFSSLLAECSGAFMEVKSSSLPIPPTS